MMDIVSCCGDKVGHILTIFFAASVVRCFGRHWVPYVCPSCNHPAHVRHSGSDSLDGVNMSVSIFLRGVIY